MWTFHVTEKISYQLSFLGLIFYPWIIIIVHRNFLNVEYRERPPDEAYFEGFLTQIWGIRYDGGRQENA